MFWKRRIRGDTVAFENAEVKILDAGKVLDTNPELYKKRALDALERQYYQDAMLEAEKAIKYGRNERKYQIVKAKVLLARGEYNSFLVYILKETRLWEYKDISFELTDEEKDFMLYGFSVSYGQLGYPPDKLPEIILTADGKGMCKSIQEAADKYSDKKIMLTGGWYNEDLCVKGKAITIIGSSYSKAKINGRWKIVDSRCTINNILFHNQAYVAGNMLELSYSEFSIEGLTFNSLVDPDSIIPNPDDGECYEDLVGLYIKESESIDKNGINNMRFSNLTSGIICTETQFLINKSIFDQCKGGIINYNKKRESIITISNCVFKENYFGCFATRNAVITIQYSTFERNDFAFGLTKDSMVDEKYVEDVPGKITAINNCQIIGSKIVAINNQGGTCIVKDSLLKNNAREYYEEGKATYLKERVTETGNTSTGPLKEGIKGFIKSLL